MTALLARSHGGADVPGAAGTGDHPLSLLHRELIAAESALTIPLLDVKHLTISYSSPRLPVQAVSDVSFQIAPGEIVALVGETGCGKSSVALSILGLMGSRGRLESGRILFRARDVTTLTEKQWRTIRGREIGFIFQDTRAALNPVLTVGAHLIETLRTHCKMSRSRARAAAVQLLEEMGIPDPEPSMSRYPLEFSGGMCQRIGIALAICGQPGLLIADEPTSALDPTLQRQVLCLLGALRTRGGLALLFISHDLTLVSDFADRVIVMYLGRLVEEGLAREVFSDPRHPYTRGLLQSQPGWNHHRENNRLTPIPGMPPSPGQIPPGCSFAPRCPVAEPRCMRGIPAPVDISDRHWAACVRTG